MSLQVPTPIVTDREAALRHAGSMPRRALFLDRDGVINVNHGYVHTVDATDWVPGIFDLARHAYDTGWVLVVVTNQAGIARGYYSRADFVEYTRWMHAEFARHGAPLLATYYCPHHPEGKLEALRVNCNCRKPKPGMLLAAVSDWNISPARSSMVGDHDTDLQAAHAAGIGRRWKLEEGGDNLDAIRARLSLDV